MYHYGGKFFSCGKGRRAVAKKTREHLKSADCPRRDFQSVTSQGCMSRRKTEIKASKVVGIFFDAASFSGSADGGGGRGPLLQAWKRGSSTQTSRRRLETLIYAVARANTEGGRSVNIQSIAQLQGDSILQSISYPVKRLLINSIPLPLPHDILTRFQARGSRV